MNNNDNENKETVGLIPCIVCGTPILQGSQCPFCGCLDQDGKRV
jgi:hypothetical protein